MRWRPEFALPIKAEEVPTGPDWFHEIKYDGYRMMVIREHASVRLISKSGLDWTKRFPWIVDAALSNRRKQFIIDGEAVLLGLDGVSDFHGLHSGKHDDEVQLYAFDILAADGEDLRKLPLSMRKTNLERVLARRPQSIFVAPFETGAIGRELFKAACNMNLEGLVSKHSGRWYGAGRCQHWRKVKNPKHPAYHRVQDQF